MNRCTANGERRAKTRKVMRSLADAFNELNFNSCWNSLFINSNFRLFCPFHDVVKMIRNRFWWISWLAIQFFFLSRNTDSHIRTQYNTYTFAPRKHGTNSDYGCASHIVDVCFLFCAAYQHFKQIQNRLLYVHITFTVSLFLCLNI